VALQAKLNAYFEFIERGQVWHSYPAAKGRQLREFARQYPDAAEPLQSWYRLLHEADWESLQDVRRVYPHADMVTVASGSTVTVFNIAGNKYRLIAAIHYNRQRVYVLRLLRHAEYSKGFWKDKL
jgi:mRNA interferase HigB